MARPSRSQSFGPATVRGGGQLTLPVELRKALGIAEGAEVLFFRWDDEGRVLMMFGEEAADAADRFVRDDLRFPPMR